jgi:hypothetical protein
MTGTEPSAGSGGMIRADFVAGLVFVVLGAAALVASLEMPRFEERAINPYTVPGLVPGALGVIILILGAVLFVRAARAGGWRAGAGAAAWHRDPGLHRLALSVALCLGYAAGLVGRLPFWLATFLFVAGFVALFEWPLARDRKDRTRRLVFAVAFGALVAAAVSYVFSQVFLVRLP